MTTSACARALLSLSLLVVCLVNVAAQQPSPSPSPSVAASPSPSATATPEASPTPRDPMSTPTFNGLRMRSIGPAFTSGRVSGFAVDPNNPTRYYVAVASGGVWKTVNAGITWTPVFDNEASYSIGAIDLCFPARCVCRAISVRCSCRRSFVLRQARHSTSRSAASMNARCQPAGPWAVR